ncbi:MAG: MarR family winged helix-turn-helix transcriptional regulator [Thermoplasmatota archaeon]
MAAASRRKLIEEATDALGRVMGAVRAGRRIGLGDADPSPMQMVALHVITRANDTTPRELAERLHVTPATVTGLLNKLEEGGLVARERDDDDRRVVHLRVTAKGDQVVKRIRARWRESLATVFETLSDDELADLARLLATAVRRVERAPA